MGFNIQTTKQIGMGGRNFEATTKKVLCAKMLCAWPSEFFSRKDFFGMVFFVSYKTPSRRYVHTGDDSPRPNGRLGDVHRPDSGSMRHRESLGGLSLHPTWADRARPEIDGRIRKKNRGVEGGVTASNGRSRKSDCNPLANPFSA